MIDICLKSIIEMDIQKSITVIITKRKMVY